MASRAGVVPCAMALVTFGSNLRGQLQIYGVALMSNLFLIFVPRGIHKARSNETTSSCILRTHSYTVQYTHGIFYDYSSIFVLSVCEPPR